MYVSSRLSSAAHTLVLYVSQDVPMCPGHRIIGGLVASGVTIRGWFV